MIAHIFFLLDFSTITIFIIFFLSSAFIGYANEYYNCSSPWCCGNFIHIGYPFWGDGRPKYCGHQALQLHCPADRNDYPVLKIGDHEHDDDDDHNHNHDDDHNHNHDDDLSFRVLGIWSSAKNLRTINLLPMQHKNSCATHIFKNGVFDKYPLNLSTNVSITSLFYDCPGNASIKSLASDSVPCFDMYNHPTTSAYYLQNQSDISCTYGPDDRGYKGCKVFEVQVLTEEMTKLKQKKENLKDVLKKGFEVDFNYSACIKCESSGGVCGSSDDQFVCYCKDHPFLRFEQCPKSEKWKLRLALGLAIPGGLCILIALNVVLCCYKKRIKLQISALLSKTFSNYHNMSDLEIGNSFFGIPVLSYSELQEATNNFDSNQELGDGGFGVVYYGKLRDDREVAVKRLYEKNFKRVGQFMNEVEILTKLRHQNLVTLYGCTSRHSRELLLVYEFIPNGTVADHLYGESRSGSGTRFRILHWSIRMKIAIQTACALSYLHASDIVHRDVKTNNILLDNDFTVKVADFGLSRLFPFDATHVSTAPQGTPGYLDPEYHKCYQVTNKSDVYSFGVVLIELISSLPAIDINRHEDEINLSDYAMNRIQNGELEALIDRNLGFESDFKVKRMTTLVAELAFQCLQQVKEVRPSMEEVFEALKLIESVDYEALESQEMDRSMGILKPTSEVGENHVDHHQQHPFHVRQTL